MNILASYNWMKDFLHDADDVASFVKKMTASGMSVEYTHDIAKRLEQMVVGVIVEVRPHPNADKLRIVMTEIGGGKVVQIVCGGVNLSVGHRVAVALPGSRVRWHGEEAWTELSVAKVRGEESFGMIAAPEELGFDKLPGQDERGPLIWDVTDLTEAEAGTPLAKALDLEDTVFDIEVTTNRPDAMSMVGLAREAGAVQAGVFQQPVTDEGRLEAEGEDALPLEVRVEDHGLCPRYQAVVLHGVKVGPSPWWLQKRLLLSGHRPINNVVDVTNYILHEFGQPLHAFDYDKLHGALLEVRRAKAEETILALDGKEYALSSDQLVIADAKGPVAVAGVMGGALSGTGEETTRVVLECATFEPVNVRKTARALNLYSDSQLVFEKGLSTEALPQALARAVTLIQELAGGQVATSVQDVREEAYTPLQFPFDPKDVNDRMGITIPSVEQERIMTSLGFTLEPSGEAFMATVPFWRDHDIEESVDFVEEIARVYGYERIPSTLPSRSVEPDARTPLLVWQDRAKVLLAAAGCTEVYSYSFASEADLRDWGNVPEEALRFLNPLSLDQAFLRVSVVPSVLRVIEANQGHRPAGLVFELANTYLPRTGDLPIEEPELVIAGYGADYDWRAVKGVMERLFREMGVSDVTFERGGVGSNWHPGRSVRVMRLGEELGVFGELARAVTDAFRLNARTTVAVLQMARVIPHASLHKHFEPVPAFPSATRDVAFVLDRLVEFGAIESVLRKASVLVRSVEVFDIYEGEGVPVGKKSMAVRVELRSDDHTLSGEEIASELSTICRVLQDTFSATIRS